MRHHILSRESHIEWCVPHRVVRSTLDGVYHIELCVYVYLETLGCCKGQPFQYETFSGSPKYFAAQENRESWRFCPTTVQRRGNTLNNTTTSMSNWPVFVTAPNTGSKVPTSVFPLIPCY